MENTSFEDKAPETFLYDSPMFQAELQQDAHHHGEVTIIEAMAVPGMTALELGAHRGVTTVALARAVTPRGHVHVFEPVPAFYAALVTNLYMNNVTNVQPHQLAMTDRAGTHAYFKNGQGSGIVRGKDGGEPLTVETISLDGFVFSEGITEVGFLNMDCEGAELLVFRGGLETLEKHAPRIFCEIHHEYLSYLRQSVHDIVKFLQARGYQVVPMSVESLGEDVTFDQCTHVYAAKDGSMPPPLGGATGAAHAHAPS